MVERGRAAKPPTLSVVVAAHHGRREFLPEAIRSLARQTLSPEAYEVVVVKDFDDDEVDSRLSDVPGRTVTFGSENLGKVLAVGVRASRGEVVSFLDDDDTFEPGKLLRVHEEFRRQPRLGYFHNGLSLMDVYGQPLNGGYPGHTGDTQWMSHAWGFCESCISIRREMIRPWVSRWEEVPKAADSFLDYVSQVSPYARKRTTEPLTCYRVHPQSTSRRTNHARSYLSTARILSSLPSDRARNSALSSLLGRYMSAAIRGRSNDRRAATWAAFQLLAAHSPESFRPDAREVACGSLIPFTPRIAWGIYALMRKGQVDWLPPAEGTPARPE